MAKTYDYLFKLLLIGDKDVGKTSLMFSFMEDHNDSSSFCALGVDFKVKTIELDGKKIKLQIWDTAGQERFSNITTAYYRGASGIILVYNITNEKSFENIEKRIQNIKEHAPSDIDWIIVGNNCDMNDKRQVSKERGEKLAQSHSKQFIEVSAKSGINVKEAFYTLTRDIMMRLNQRMRETMNKDYDLFKLMMIGDSVGKSCLLLRYIKGSFKSDIDVTVVDMAIKMIELDGKKIQLQIWDTTGHESFRSVVIQCCRDAKHAPSDVDWMIVGNKCDMNDKRQVSKESGEKLANSYSKKFMEVSAKSGINVEEAFYTLARDIMTRLRMNDPSSSSGPGKCLLL